MSDKKEKKVVSYNRISIEPSGRLGAPIEEVLERRKQLLCNFRQNK